MSDQLTELQGGLNALKEKVQDIKTVITAEGQQVGDAVAELKQVIADLRAGNTDLTPALAKLEEISADLDSAKGAIQAIFEPETTAEQGPGLFDGEDVVAPPAEEPVTEEPAGEVTEPGATEPEPENGGEATAPEQGGEETDQAMDSNIYGRPKDGEELPA
jgi:hypothetical protein